MKITDRYAFALGDAIMKKSRPFPRPSGIENETPPTRRVNAGQ
jgi:hypothetical protein